MYNLERMELFGELIKMEKQNIRESVEKEYLRWAGWGW